MTKKQFRARLWLLIVLALVLIGLLGFAGAKYIKTETFHSSVTFKAALAKEVILQEHYANRLDSGEYELIEPFVTENTYYLIPGLDVDKDPHVIIRGKTPIEAYLFVEIVDTLDVVNDQKPVEWSINAANWTLLNGVTGRNGGTVYYYNGGALRENFPEDPIYILENNQVTVSQTLRKYITDETQDDVLTFYVSLIETTGQNENYAAVYNRG